MFCLNSFKIIKFVENLHKLLKVMFKLRKLKIYVYLFEKFTFQVFFVYKKFISALLWAYTFLRYVIEYF